MRKWDLDNHTSSRSLTRPAGNPGNNPAARNDHTTQPEKEPAPNRSALKPLALGTGGQDGAAGVNRLLLLRECLLSALTTVGLLVSAGVLTTGAQRQAALADPRHTGPYPSAYVLIWGLAFSALLVVNFLPAFRRLIRLANATVDTLFPILPPGSDGWQNRLKERKDLADLLKVTSGAKDVITSSILVAGPLISSAFSLFLPGPPPG